MLFVTKKTAKKPAVVAKGRRRGQLFVAPKGSKPPPVPSPKYLVQTRQIRTARGVTTFITAPKDYTKKTKPREKTTPDKTRKQKEKEKLTKLASAASSDSGASLGSFDFGFPKVDKPTTNPKLSLATTVDSNTSGSTSLSSKNSSKTSKSSTSYRPSKAIHELLEVASIPDSPAYPRRLTRSSKRLLQSESPISPISSKFTFNSTNKINLGKSFDEIATSASPIKLSSGISTRSKKSRISKFNSSLSPEAVSLLTVDADNASKPSKTMSSNRSTRLSSIRASSRVSKNTDFHSGFGESIMQPQDDIDSSEPQQYNESNTILSIDESIEISPHSNLQNSHKNFSPISEPSIYTSISKSKTRKRKSILTKTTPKRKTKPKKKQKLSFTPLASNSPIAQNLSTPKSTITVSSEIEYVKDNEKLIKPLPSKEATPGKRRSTRTRWKPLEFWRGERVLLKKDVTAAVLPVAAKTTLIKTPGLATWRPKVRRAAGELVPHRPTKAVLAQLSEKPIDGVVEIYDELDEDLVQLRFSKSKAREYKNPRYDKQVEGMKDELETDKQVNRQIPYKVTKSTRDTGCICLSPKGMKTVEQVNQPFEFTAISCQPNSLVIKAAGEKFMMDQGDVIEIPTNGTYCLFNLSKTVQAVVGFSTMIQDARSEVDTRLLTDADAMTMVSFTP